MDARSWYGLVNQSAHFPVTTPVMEPFRELLMIPMRKRMYWDDQLKLRFCQAQESICQLAKDRLVCYDRTRPTAMVMDWSQDGSGFIMLQQHCSCTSPDAPFAAEMDGGWRCAAAIT